MTERLNCIELKVIIKNRKLTAPSVIQSMEEKECMYCGENTKCWWHYPVEINI